MHVNKPNLPTDLKYIEDCYQESFYFLNSRKKRQVSQLILLNNLQRGDTNIASTLLLTLFDRVLSSLYDDKIQVKFLPSQGITQTQINSYNTLAQSDFLEMEKPKLDYDWCWDTLFFGRGYCETLRFDKKRKIMKPEIINPLVFGYDPYFENVQDWRYYWKWITKSKTELKRLIKNGTITNIKSPDEIPNGVEPYLWNYKIRRDEAKLAVPVSADTIGGDVFQILEFYQYNDEGKKCVYWVDRSFAKVIWEEELEVDEDGERKWPIVVKEAFREPHSSVNFSVADLLEDKHRAKSVLLNLAFLAAKDRANPLYVYNQDKVTDVTQLFSRQINQHIPVNDIEGAIKPLNTEDPMSAGLIQFISMLTQEANEPIGVGQVMQPLQAKGDKTATADAINQQMNDMAQSLLSKVMQFGEAEFWSHWFHEYARNGKELESKMANIVGVKGVDTTIIKFEDFNTEFPPGVMVYSAKEAEYKELVMRRDLMQLYPNLMQSLDPDGMRNFNKYVFFPKFLQDPSLVDIMLPKTLDEMKAEGENEQLAKDTMPNVSETDNHTTHIYVHHMTQPKTWALWTHIAWHEELLDQQKKQQAMQGGQQDGQNKVSESISFKDLPPDGQVQMAGQAGIQLDPAQMAQMPQQQGKPQSPSKPAVNKTKTSQTSMASPLKSEINTQPVVR
jgi:hypothetical protein